MSATIGDPIPFFSGLGGLHDADVKQLSWDPVKRSLRLEVDDLNANSAGLPEYPGLQPCTLVFNEVSLIDLRCDIQKQDTIRIYGFRVSKRVDGNYELVFQLSPSGEIALQFGVVEVEEKVD